MNPTSIVDRRQSVMGTATLFYDDPIEIVRGEGAFLYDKDGKQYVDMYNNVPCVGHANPNIVAAMQQQMGTLNVHSRYLHEGILTYAERLLALHTAKMESVVFACSGTEASEIALMMARHATDGKGIICTDATYHGNSTEVSKMSARPVTDEYFRSIPFPDSYRPLEIDVSGEALTQLYLDKIQEAIDDFAANNIPFAGLFVCSIFANEGLPDIPPGFMEKAAVLTRKAGGLVIADEVQAGYCRSGNWWGYQTSHFVPDIATMGKPMGNGLPISAVVASADLVATFRDKTHYFNTFASSPLQAAVGIAVLDEIESKGLLNQSATLGQYIQDSLSSMQESCAAMGDVRGCGLFVGVDWVKDRESREADSKGANAVANKLKEKGFLLSSAGAKGNVVKIRPPLVFEKDQADSFLGAFQESLRDLNLV